MTGKAYRSISAIALAALIAGAATVLPSLSESVVASAPMHGGKSARLDVRPLSNGCSEQAWPYFEANCIRDNRLAFSKVGTTARIVTANRVPGAR